MYTKWNNLCKVISTNYMYAHQILRPKLASSVAGFCRCTHGMLHYANVRSHCVWIPNEVNQAPPPLDNVKSNTPLTFNYGQNCPVVCFISLCLSTTGTLSLAFLLPSQNTGLEVYQMSIKSHNMGVVFTKKFFTNTICRSILQRNSPNL